MSGVRTTALPVRSWDPDRPVLAALLARREELCASYVDLMGGEAVFTTLPEQVPGVAPGAPGWQAALHAVQSVPEIVVEAYDLAPLLAEQMSDAEQMLGALREGPDRYEVAVRTRTQPMVRIDMPADGVRVGLQVSVQRPPAQQVVRVTIGMPFLNADGTQMRD